MRALLRILSIIGAAASGLFLSWASCVDLTHWVQMREHVSYADPNIPHCRRTSPTQAYWSGGGCEQ